jgi:hypothetical protein
MAANFICSQECMCTDTHAYRNFYKLFLIKSLGVHLAGSKFIKHTISYNKININMVFIRSYENFTISSQKRYWCFITILWFLNIYQKYRKPLYQF